MTTHPISARADTSFTAGVVYGIVALWALFVVQMSRDGLYIASNHQPPVALGLSVLLPVACAVAAYRRHGRFWLFCQRLDLRVIVVVHLWRLMAVDFLLCCWDGRLPASFALPAGIGDVLTAPPLPRCHCPLPCFIPRPRRDAGLWRGTRSVLPT